jgi:hypothetical protein
MPCAVLSGYNESNFDDGTVLHNLVLLHFCGATLYMNALDVFDGFSCFINSVLGCLFPALC